jgi:hypothetical protein
VTQLKTESTAAKAERAKEAAQKKEATYNQARVKFPDCGTRFYSETFLAKHCASKCGSYARRGERRRAHDEGTTRAQIKALDGDIADELEAAVERGLDIVKLKFNSPTFGYFFKSGGKSKSHKGYVAINTCG